MGLGELFTSYQKFSEAIEPLVSDVYNPASRLETGIGLLLLDFLATLFHVRDVLSLFDSLLRWITEVPFLFTDSL